MGKKCTKITLQHLIDIFQCANDEVDGDVLVAFCQGRDTEHCTELRGALVYTVEALYDDPAIPGYGRRVNVKDVNEVVDGVPDRYMCMLAFVDDLPDSSGVVERAIEISQQKSESGGNL